MKTSRFTSLFALAALIAAPLVFPSPTYAAIEDAEIGLSLQEFNLTGSYSTVAGQPTGSGAFSPSNAGPYIEGSCVPLLVDVTNNSSPAETGDLSFRVIYDFHGNSSSLTMGVRGFKGIITGLADPSSADNLNDFTYLNDFPAASAFSNSNGGITNATISGPYAGNDSGTSPLDVSDTVRHYNVTLSNVAPGVTVHFLACAELGLDAGDFPNPSMNLSAAAGTSAPVGPASISTSEILKLATLTIEKQVDGGTANPSNWTFHISPPISDTADFVIQPGTSTVTFVNVPPDTYTVTEKNGPADYSLTNASGDCSFANQTPTVEVTAGNEAPGFTCVLTNTYSAPVQQTGSVTYIVNVINDDVGTATPADFQILPRINGNVITSFQGDSNGTTVTLPSGNLSFSDGVAPGYLIESASPDCGGVLDPNESLTCTITYNDVDPGAVTYVVNVINDNVGTATPADFKIIPRVDGNAITEFQGDSNGTTVTLPSGTLTFSDGVAPGYLIESTTPDCGGALDVGETQLCVITYNDVDPAAVTYVVNVINDNVGTATPADFKILPRIDGNVITEFQGDSNGTVVHLPTGQLTFSDGVAPGYLIESASEGCGGTLNLGETKLCVITYNDVDPGVVTYVVNVINDNVGTATPADFKIIPRVDGNAITEFQGDSNGTTVTLPSGTLTFSDGVAPGYLIESTTPDCGGALDVGETQLCVITYNDVDPAAVTYVVNVINDNVGTATPEDFKILPRVDGNVITEFQGTSHGKVVHLPTGYLTFSDGVAPGYLIESTSPGCGGPLNLGETKLCVITYNDVDPAAVTYVVNVINDNGGTAASADFQILPRIDGNVITNFQGSSHGLVIHLPPGELSFSDGVAPGYLIENASPGCGGTLSLGETKLCVITYNDVATSTPTDPQTGTLTVIKHVVDQTCNPDDETCQQNDTNPNLFTLSVYSSSSSMVLVQGSDTGSQVSLTPGGYSVIEDPGENDPSLTSLFTASYSEDCFGAIAAGEQKVCTITNTDNDILGTGNTDPGPGPGGSSTGTATIIVQTVVINNDGGWRTAADFQQSISATNASVTNFSGSSTGIAITVDPGTYDVSEVDPALYTKSLSANCSGTISAGQTITCVITNDDFAQSGGSGGGTSVLLTAGNGGGSGGSSSGGGPSSGGGSTPSTGGSTPTPPGEVLGAVDEESPAVTPVVTDPGTPAPTTGATELPRTGLPLGILLLSLLPAAGVALQRKER